MDMSRALGVAKVCNRHWACDQLCMLYFLCYFTCIFVTDKNQLNSLSNQKEFNV